jgi:hypothetical protein
MTKRSAIALAAAAMLALPAAAAADQPAGTSDALRALHLRSEGMNRVYVERPTPTPSTPAATPAEGFDWSDAALGAGAGFALALGGAACALSLRRRTGIAHT